MTIPMSEMTPSEQAAMDSLAHYQRWEAGYSTQQSTRPQTLGYGLVDSPAAQAAWIVEKFWAWTDCDGHPENVLTRDELLDNVMMYWVTASAASSARMYWESFRVFGGLARVEVPTGVVADRRPGLAHTLVGHPPEQERICPLHRLGLEGADPVVEIGLCPGRVLEDAVQRQVLDRHDPSHPSLLHLV